MSVGVTRTKHLFDGTLQLKAVAAADLLKRGSSFSA